MSDEKQLHNKEIVAKKYFTMDAAIEAPIISNTAFIIANERIKKSGEVGRYYTVFPKFRDFLHNRHLFPNCHEILIDHKNARINVAGRLVFDFDIKDIVITNNFKSQIEDIISHLLGPWSRSEVLLAEVGGTHGLEFNVLTTKRPQNVLGHVVPGRPPFAGQMISSEIAGLDNLVQHL